MHSSAGTSPQEPQPSLERQGYRLNRAASATVLDTVPLLCDSMALVSLADLPSLNMTAHETEGHVPFSEGTHSPEACVSILDGCFQ